MILIGFGLKHVLLTMTRTLICESDFYFHFQQHLQMSSLKKKKNTDSTFEYQLQRVQRRSDRPEFSCCRVDARKGVSPFQLPVGFAVKIVLWREVAEATLTTLKFSYYFLYYYHHADPVMLLDVEADVAVY